MTRTNSRSQRHGTPKRFQVWAILALLACTVGCGSLYKVTTTPTISPTTGETQSVAVAVAPTSTMSNVFQTAAGLAPVTGPYAPLVSGATQLGWMALCFGAGIYQWFKQKNANASLTTVIKGVEAFSAAPPQQGAATVKETIDTISRILGTRDQVDAAVQQTTKANGS